MDRETIGTHVWIICLVNCIERNWDCSVYSFLERCWRAIEFKGEPSIVQCNSFDEFDDSSLEIVSFLLQFSCSVCGPFGFVIHHRNQRNPTETEFQDFNGYFVSFVVFYEDSDHWRAFYSIHSIQLNPQLPFLIVSQISMKFLIVSRSFTGFLFCSLWNAFSICKWESWKVNSIPSSNHSARIIEEAKTVQSALTFESIAKKETRVFISLAFHKILGISLLQGNLLFMNSDEVGE